MDTQKDIKMTVNADAVDSTQTSTPDTNTEVDTTVLELQKEIESKTKLIEKLRQNEKHNQQLAKDIGAKNLEDALKALQTGLTKEAEEWKVKYESINNEYTSLRDSIKSKELDTVLKETLSKSNVKDVNTVLKVIDKSQIKYTEDGHVDTTALDSFISELRQTDPILFNEPTLPEVKSAGNGSPVSGYEKEITTAKTHKEITAILKKYNKI